jgi:hypothetical protein
MNKNLKDAGGLSATVPAWKIVELHDIGRKLCKQQDPALTTVGEKVRSLADELATIIKLK